MAKCLKQDTFRSDNGRIRVLRRRCHRVE
jgi:hypothetical protein